MARITVFGLSMRLTCLAPFNHLLALHGLDVAVSVVFTSVVASQRFNGIRLRRRRGPFFRGLRGSLTINPGIFIGVGAGLALQLAALYLAPTWSHSAPLTVEEVGVRPGRVASRASWWSRPGGGLSA